MSKLILWKYNLNWKQREQRSNPSCLKQALCWCNECVGGVCYISACVSVCVRVHVCSSRVTDFSHSQTEPCATSLVPLRCMCLTFLLRLTAGKDECWYIINKRGHTHTHTLTHTLHNWRTCTRVTQSWVSRSTECSKVDIHTGQQAEYQDNVGWT